jgi:hypothetical protein
MHSVLNLVNFLPHAMLHLSHHGNGRLHEEESAIQSIFAEGSKHVRLRAITNTSQGDTWIFAAPDLARNLLSSLKITESRNFSSSCIPWNNKFWGYVAVCVAVEQRQLNVRQWTVYNKAARRRQHNLKTYWIIQCSGMLKNIVLSHETFAYQFLTNQTLVLSISDHLHISLSFIKIFNPLFCLHCSALKRMWHV